MIEPVIGSERLVLSKIIRNDSIGWLIEKQSITNENRDYIGYSGIGEKCKRKLWYDYRWCSNNSITRRIQRLFNRGHQEEAIIIKDLLSIGIKVTDEQLEVVNCHNTYLRGHIDGIATCVPGFENTQMLLEMKTANHANFGKIKKDGIKKFSNKYWMQIQGYMQELGLDYCLYVVTNKNNDERLYLIEEYSIDDTKDIEYIVGDILDNAVVPERIGDRTWYECKFCNNFDICHTYADAVKTCRSCEHCLLSSKEYSKGKMTCLLTKEEKEGYTACSRYDKLSAL